MAVYRAKKTHIINDGKFNRRVITAYETEVETDEELPEDVYPFYFRVDVPTKKASEYSEEKVYKAVRVEPHIAQHTAPVSDID